MPETEEFITKTRKYETSKRDVGAVLVPSDSRVVAAIVFRVFVLLGFRDCPMADLAGNGRVPRGLKKGGLLRCLTCDKLLGAISRMSAVSSRLARVGVSDRRQTTKGRCSRVCRFLRTDIAM